MEGVLIQAVDNYFQLCLSFSEFLSLIQIFQIIEIAQLLVWEIKIQRWKWSLQWCVCVRVHVCDTTRIVLRKYWSVYSNWWKNVRGMVRVFPCTQGNSLWCTVGNILSPIKVSVSGRYIQMIQIFHK